MRKVLLSVLMLLVLLGVTALASAETTTVMMYMCGTDLQEDCLTDIGEMCTASTGSNVRIVVLAGGAKTWSDSRLKAKRLNLFTIENGKWSAVTDWGSDSMGSPDTLKKFVTYCWQQYRGDRNVLIMWDHGSSALDGLCFDEVHNDDGLTLSELSDCFADLSRNLSGFHLNVIGADACLMACYEMAVTLAPYGDYYVASEELEPYLGWDYVNWLKALDAQPGMSDRELAVAIVDSYIYGSNRDDPNDYLTLSAVDLSKMTTLQSLINSLAATLTEQMNGGQLSSISRTIRSMYIFGNYDDAGSDMVDLTEFLTMCSAYDADTAAKAQSTMNEAVIYSYANSYVPKATGMSIFVPMENSDWLAETIDDYASEALTGYVSFVRAFGNVSSGSSWTFTANNAGQMSREDYDDGFWSSASVFIGGNTSGSWSSWGSGGYEYGSGFGSNVSGITIGGTIGGSQPQATASTAQSGGGITIGGTAGQSASAVAATEAPTATAVPAATAAAAIQQETVDMTGKKVFSIQLSEEDMQYLSYAELLLFQDFSDETGWDLDELGRVRSTWIDWENRTVYGMLDGTWPVIGDVYVVLYEQSRTDAGRRCIIPVLLNDTTKTYLVVEYPAGSTEGTILGTSEGWSENGLPVRGVTPLEVGDVFTPIYPTYMTADTAANLSVDAMSTAWTVYNDAEFLITWDGTQTVTVEDLPDAAELKLAFRLHDIFGGYTTTSMITYDQGE